jgi:hypothetical protein
MMRHAIYHCGVVAINLQAAKWQFYERDKNITATPAYIE